MNTPSHFLINAAIYRCYRGRGIVRSAFLLGSVAPDVPLVLLSLGGAFYFTRVRGMGVGDAFQHMFDTLFFTDPGWIAFHHLLHSPTLLGFYLALLWRPRRTQAWAQWGWYFVWGALVHTVLDIVTHHSDGPLLLFPLEWTLRFRSPVSYWEPQYYGREFALFEGALCVVLLIYLLLPHVWQRIRRKQPVGADER